jgi:DNA-binding transcriptional MerR regulator
LLKPTARSEAGHRLYGQEEVAQLQFINRASLAGITKLEVRVLALIAEGERGEDSPHVEEVLEEKLRRLSAYEGDSASGIASSTTVGRFEEDQGQVRGLPLPLSPDCRQSLPETQLPIWCVLRTQR